MYRNLMNRWWSGAAAFAVALMLLVCNPGRSLANAGLPGAGGTDPGTPGDPGTTGAGDPDVPTNTGRSVPVVRQRVVLGSMRHAPAGSRELGTLRNAWVFKIRVALQGVRLFYLHD